MADAGPRLASVNWLGLTRTRIVLTGFMGSGKTSVGRRLARRLAWPFVDADQAIETAAETTIAEIFATRGEPWFRSFEAETIASLLARQPLVLALGGGALETEATRERLLADPACLLVYLDASLETLLRRCSGTDRARPVLADRANLEARFERRLPLYRQAHLTLPSDHLNPAQAAATIAARLGLPPSPTQRFPQGQRRPRQ